VLIAAAAAAGALIAAPPPLHWTPCGDAPGVECSTLRVPLDYDRPHGEHVGLAVARARATAPSRRIGALLVPPGTPGGEITAFVKFAGSGLLSPRVGERFDMVGLDARGAATGPAISCGVDNERQGTVSQPFATPLTLAPAALIAGASSYVGRCLSRNGPILAHASTANYARDLELLRRALGEPRANLFGFAKGTIAAATYATLFGGRQRAMVLDAPIDADAYFARPLEVAAAEAGASERALGRFLSACAIGACGRFGGPDPWDAFDRLLDRLDRAPLPGSAADPRPVDGDDVRAAVFDGLLCWQCRHELGDALASAAEGDGSAIRERADIFYGRDPATGSGNSFFDLRFTIGASEQHWPRNVDAYLEAGQAAWEAHDHFWFDSGYGRLANALWPIRDDDAFDGPFRIPPTVPPALVVATTYDPAAPYRGAVRTTRALGNARLLTLRGDGIGAYGMGGSPCIDALVEEYLMTLALPPEGTSCTQAASHRVRG
jgi:pimeloyl-ACP methyl ester carboxylesterase